MKITSAMTTNYSQKTEYNEMVQILKGHSESEKAISDQSAEEATRARLATLLMIMPRKWQMNKIRIKRLLNILLI